MPEIEQPNNQATEIRSLKVQSKHRANRWSETFVPELKLSGHWLEAIGFLKEARVTVYASKELIVIRPEGAEWNH